MSNKRRSLRMMLRMSILAVSTVLASITVALPAAQAQVIPLCSDGHDVYRFTPPLTLIPKDTRFRGTGASASTCVIGTAPNGATEVLMVSASMGRGQLACSVNAFVEGQLTFHWLKDSTQTVATTQVELTFMEIGGASKKVVMRGIVTSGAFEGSLMLLDYISTADTQQCVVPGEDGLEIVPGQVVLLTFTP